MSRANRIRPRLIQEINQICNIQRIRQAIAAWIACLRRHRRSAMLIQEINKMRNVKSIDYAATISISADISRLYPEAE